MKNQQACMGKPRLGYSWTFSAYTILLIKVLHERKTLKSKGFQIFYRGKFPFLFTRICPGFSLYPLMARTQKHFCNVRILQ